MVSGVLTCLFGVKNRLVELLEHHVVGVGDVACGTGVFRQRRRCLGIRRRVVAEIEEAPTVGVFEAFAVLHRDIDTVQRSWEEAAARDLYR